jgi:hypothetical protein
MGQLVLGDGFPIKLNGDVRLAGLVEPFREPDEPRLFPNLGLLHLRLLGVRITGYERQDYSAAAAESHLVSPCLRPLTLIARKNIGSRAHCSACGPLEMLHDEIATAESGLKQWRWMAEIAGCPSKLVL